MKSRAEWEAEQNRLLERYEDAQKELAHIPGVVCVGVGLRHRDNRLVEEAVYTVSVREKRAPQDVHMLEHIPPALFGVPTDVIEYREAILTIGFGDENDLKDYKTKVGGIAIKSEDANTGGTLGCFCTRNDNGDKVLLSCRHVLFDGFAKEGSGVGQHQYDYSCCCTTNEMGKVIKGDINLDCAIASVKKDVATFPKLRRIKRADGSIEEEGLIKSSAAAVIGQIVYKIGHKTGLTRGKITQLLPRMEIEHIGPNRFCDHGDSGSIIVEKSTGNVVALLYGMQSEDGLIGYGKPMTTVEAVLGVKIIPSDPTATYTEMDFDDEEDASVAIALPPASPFEALLERLRASSGGRLAMEVVERHRAECMRLVRARRGFTVAWHRNQGPAWLAALGRSARDPIYQLPHEINGVSRASAITEITDALLNEAGDDLRAAIESIREPVGRALVHAESVDELCAQIEQYQKNNAHVSGKKSAAVAASAS